MKRLQRTTATLATAALLAAPVTMLGAAPAHADDWEKEKEFRIAGAEADFSVEKDDGRFEIEVDIDDAKPGSKWRVVLWHDGRRYHKKVYRADGDGEIEIEKNRRNTRGKDVFKVKIKKIGGPKKTRTIRMR